MIKFFTNYKISRRIPYITLEFHTEKLQTEEYTTEINAMLQIFEEKILNYKNL